MRTTHPPLGSNGALNMLLLGRESGVNVLEPTLQSCSDRGSEGFCLDRRVTQFQRQHALMHPRGWASLFANGITP